MRILPSFLQLPCSNIKPAKTNSCGILQGVSVVISSIMLELEIRKKSTIPYGVKLILLLLRCRQYSYILLNC